MLLLGDCLERLKEIPDNHVDAVVTDPPYGLSFMGKKWDYEVPSVAIWKEVLRVLKPGGHLLSFAGTRTYHRMAVNIEDAGFEVRDMVSWIYGQGFPKSHNISKAIDKAAGAEREVVGAYSFPDGSTRNTPRTQNVAYAAPSEGSKQTPITAPATDLAKQWEGWGTALKPALEPVCLARKPLIGTIVENVLEHGTGGLNIDASRIATDRSREREYDKEPLSGITGDQGSSFTSTHARNDEWLSQGRWPSNVILDEEAGRVMDEQTGNLKFSYATNEGKASSIFGGELGAERNILNKHRQGDSGGASRFFYCAKVSGKERNAGLEGMPNRFSSMQKNTHPTVKPVKLMEYLCKLVTPPGGVILDPFMGSGSTGIAAMVNGFKFIGIEREAEYLEIAKARISSKTVIVETR